MKDKPKTTDRENIVTVVLTKQTRNRLKKYCVNHDITMFDWLELTINKIVSNDNSHLIEWVEKGNIYTDTIPDDSVITTNIENGQDENYYRINIESHWYMRNIFCNSEEEMNNTYNSIMNQINEQKEE